MRARFAQLAKEVAVFGASGSLSQVIGFLLLPVYTSSLTPVEFGVWTLLGLVTMVFSLVANLGLPSGVLRHVMVAKDEAIQAELIRTGATATFLSTVICGVAAYAARAEISTIIMGTDTYGHVVGLAILAASAQASGSVYEQVLRARRRVRAVGGLSGMKAVVLGASTATLLLLLPRGLLGAVEALVLAECVGLVALVVVCRADVRFGMRRRELSALLGYSLPLIPHRAQMLAVTLFSQWAVRSLMGLEEAGLLGLAQKFASPLRLLVNAVQRAWLPFRLELQARERDPAAFFRVMTTFYLSLLAILWLGASLWAPEVLRVFAVGHDFDRAAHIVPFVAAVPVLQAAYWMFGAGFETGANTTPAPLISFVGAVAVVVSAFALIPTIGAYGAPLSAAIGWIAMIPVLVHFTRKRFPVDHDWSTLALVAVFAIASVGCASMLPTATVLERSIVAFGLSIAGPLLVIGAVARRDDYRRQLVELVGARANPAQ